MLLFLSFLVFFSLLMLSIKRVHPLLFFSCLISKITSFSVTAESFFFSPYLIGNHELHINHDVYTQRLDKDGVPIARDKEEVGIDARSAKVELEKKTDCGNCYGANENETQYIFSFLFLFLNFKLR